MCGKDAFLAPKCFHLFGSGIEEMDGGLDFGDGGIPLLDFRFADDTLLFATSSNEAPWMVDALVTCLKEVGLELNARIQDSTLPTQA